MIIRISLNISSMSIQPLRPSLSLIRLFVVLFTTVAGMAPFPLSAQSEVNIIRFDREFYEVLGKKSNQSIETLARRYPSFIKVYSDGVIKRPLSDLVSFFNNPHLMSLYEDALMAFGDVSQLEKELKKAFGKVNELFKRGETPKVYMHVSGISQSIVVGEGFLSISIDKYLGSDYPLYRNYLYDYQYKQMVKERIAVDCIRAWLYTEFPFSPKEKNLLTYMIYEGRIMTILQATFPDKPIASLMGYTQEEWRRVVANEKRIWGHIVGKKQLYSQDPILIAKYINVGPNSSFLSSDLPDRLGIFIGTRIAEAYKKGAPSLSVEQYMEEAPQEILVKARYKP